MDGNKADTHRVSCDGGRCACMYPKHDEHGYTRHRKQAFASGNASADAHTGGCFGESVQALDFPMMVLHKGGIVPHDGIVIKSF